MRLFVRNHWMFVGYVLVLVVLLAALGLALSGGANYSGGKVVLLDETGAERYTFKQGEWVYVKRSVCAKKSLFSSLSPVLFDVDRKAIIPLADYSLVVKPGCDERSAGFQIPPGLPAGPYEYRNTVRFQNNWVGRDEAQPYAPINLMVTQ